VLWDWFSSEIREEIYRKFWQWLVGRMASADENKQESSPGLARGKFPSRMGGGWS
jgi:hypothetical protein